MGEVGGAWGVSEEEGERERRVDSLASPMRAREWKGDEVGGRWNVGRGRGGGEGAEGSEDEVESVVPNTAAPAGIGCTA